MTIEELMEIFKKCKIQIDCEVTEDSVLNDLGVDSLELSMIAYEIDSLVGKELEFGADLTIREVLEKINAELK